MANFLFDSGYQVVTWVSIAASISSFFFFAGKPSGQRGQGMAWSAISLCLATAVMIILLAKRYFYDAEKAPRLEKEPNIGVFETIFEVSKSLGTPVLAIKNYGDAMALNVRARCQFLPFTVKEMPTSGTYPPPPPFIGAYNAAANPPFTLRPGEIVGVGPVPPYTKDRTRDIRNGKELLLVYYYAIYQDESGNDYWFEYYSWFEHTSKRFKVCDTHNRHGKGQNEAEPKAVWK